MLCRAFLHSIRALVNLRTKRAGEQEIGKIQKQIKDLRAKMPQRNNAKTVFYSKFHAAAAEVRGDDNRMSLPERQGLLRTANEEFGKLSTQAKCRLDREKEAVVASKLAERDQKVLGLEVQVDPVIYQEAWNKFMKPNLGSFNVPR